MTLPLETQEVKDEYARRALDKLAMQFPVAGHPTSGFINMYAGSTAPNGWKICDGTAISRTNYAALFKAIGTTYGAGDGSTTFNIPDLRDRVAVGVSGTHALAATWGQQAPTMPATNTGTQSADHTHAYAAAVVVATIDGGSTANVATAVGTQTGGMSANHTHAISGVGSATDGNYPPSLGINYIIKL